MAYATWPTFPGENGEPTIERVDANIHSLSQGQTEFSVNLSALPRYRYTFRYNGLRTTKAAPSPYAAMSELAAAQSLVASLFGSFGRIYVVDPQSGSSVLCRLEKDSFELQKRYGGTWYEVEVTFISVL